MMGKAKAVRVSTNQQLAWTLLNVLQVGHTKEKSVDLCINSIHDNK